MFLSYNFHQPWDIWVMCHDEYLKLMLLRALYCCWISIDDPYIGNLFSLIIILNTSDFDQFVDLHRSLFPGSASVIVYSVFGEVKTTHSWLLILDGSFSHFVCLSILCVFSSSSFLGYVL